MIREALLILRDLVAVVLLAGTVLFVAVLIMAVNAGVIR